MFYIEEKQPNGKWKRGRFPFTKRDDAQRVALDLDEHGSGIAFRVVSDEVREPRTGAGSLD